MNYNEKTFDRICYYEICDNDILARGSENKAKSFKGNKSFNVRIPFNQINPMPEYYKLRNRVYILNLFVGFVLLIFAITTQHIYGFYWLDVGVLYVTSLCFFIMAYIRAQKVTYARFFSHEGVPILDIAKSNNDFECFIEKIVACVKKA